MSMYPLIRTKIRAPRLRRSLLRRPRLVDFIHANIHLKLILISAGAGYGKTSLLIDYAHDSDLPICWYSLDRNDAHVLTFVEYLVASIRQRFPAFGDLVSAYLEEQSGAPEDVEPLVRLLVHEIEEHTNRYFALVLDDYHEAIDSEPVNALVDGMLRYLPEHCHLILASRAIPRRLTLTRLAARQEVVGLGVEDLRFTADEIRDVLAKLGYTDLSAEQVETLATRTEGWITGILLAAQADRSGATRSLLEISGASAGVFDYMADEILRRQPPELQRFLMGSALLTEMSPALCNALLGIDDSAQILRDLSDRNLFTIALDAEGAWYQYHQIFREFLTAKLERDDPDGYRALCLKQAHIMAHRGDWQSATESYLLADAHDQAAEALEIIVQDLYDAGEWEALRTTIDRLPQPVLGEHPRLLLFRAKVHSEAGELSPAASLLAQSYRVYLDRHDDVGAARALVQTATVQRFRGQPQEAIATSQHALELAAGRDPLTSIQALREVGISRFMQGHVVDARRDLGEALRLAQAGSDDTNAALLAIDLGTVELSCGDLTSARRHYHQALLFWRRVGNESGLANALLNLGVVHHYLGQYAEAEARFQEGLSKARAVSDARIETYVLASLGDLYRETGRYEAALGHYRSAQNVATTGQFSTMLIYCLDAEANTHRLMGDLARAAYLLDEALDQAAGGALDYEEGLCRLSLGILALARGEPAAAREGLRAALAPFERTGALRDSARTHLYLAAAAHAEGDGDAVAAEMGRVGELAARLGTTQFAVAEAPTIGDLLRHAAARSLGGLDYVRIGDEVERLRPAPVPAATVLVARSERALEFLALEGAQVRRNGALVTDWESVSAKHMAFLFVSHPEGLSRDRVVAMLWPSVSQERGSSLFHSTMYRLRSALFSRFIVHRNGTYRVSPDCTFYYDADEFQRLARQGQGEDELAHAARAQAIALYRTPFLEGLDCEWGLATREALHTQMVDLLIREARYLAELGDIAQAETHFLRARALEPYDERAHRGIMWCRAQSRDHAGATRQYRECARALREELGTEPSPETLTLYTAIRDGVVPLSLR